MSRKAIYIFLIILGCALLLATASFWLDTLTSTEPVGLGQQIRDWLIFLLDLIAWISAYIIKKNDKSKQTNLRISGGNPQIATGEHGRNIQTGRDYVEKQVNIHLSPESEDEEEKAKRKYRFRNLHEFKSPTFLYRPIQDTVIKLEKKLETIKGGYIGVFGPPGSGKSTFLTQTLRSLPVRLIRYYAYVPDAQDPSILRGESINFFHDITLSIQQLGIGDKVQPDPTDRIALIELFSKQLPLLGKDYQTTKAPTVILVDGLDHIAREQHPERSLITDLPSPSDIPEGVYIIIGSQTSELPNLPVSVQQTLKQSTRTILMDKLSMQNVYEIVQQTLPELESKFLERIYQIVDGHPLSLVYLLSALVQSDSPDHYDTIIEKTKPYQGNIEEQYFAHWQEIENDSDFEKLLGLLARIRGPIPMEWVAEWTNKTSLKKIQRVFGQYFMKDSIGRWEFFHNSFRIFLEIQTSQPLPGLTSEQIDQKYHLQLAQQYEKAKDPWKWETLYHYFRSGEYPKVVEIGTHEWFKAQVEALRPIDAIETDVRLAVKSAGELLDPVALIRYTMIGASLQQRVNVIEDTKLAHLLIEVDKTDLAIDYARDGAKLRLKDKAALSFCRNLYNADLQQEAIRVFELAEPLEQLSGRLISKQDEHSRDLSDLLSEWVESAILFRSPSEIINVIRRIKMEPLWNNDTDISQASRNLQNWLLHTGALNCCEREDWDGWQLFIDALDEKQDHTTRYFTILRTTEYLREIKNNKEARALLERLLNMDEPKSFGSGRNRISNLLSIAELVFFLQIDDYEAISKKWFERIEVVRLSDRETSHDQSPKLIDLHFRFSRLKFLLTPSISPDQLIKEAEVQTVFEDYEDKETKLARRQLALIAYTLAKLWVDGPGNTSDEPSIFLGKIKWIFDLLEFGWNSTSATFHLQSDGAKDDISKYIVICGARHGRRTLEAVKNEFLSRWEKDTKIWWADVQRQAVLAIVDHDQNFDWAKTQLERIETFMFHGLDVYGRVQECEKHATAWLHIGEKTHAADMLYQLTRSARGIYSEKDYQLSLWASWIRKTNQLDTSGATSRIEKFVQQILGIEETASGIDNALLIMVQAVFDISPHQSIPFYKALLERKSITHDEGMASLLLSALNKECYLWDIKAIVEDVLFPFAINTSPELIRTLIKKTNDTMGSTVAIEISEQLAERLMVVAPANKRASWMKGINEGLFSIGINPQTIGLHEIHLEEDGVSSGSLDHKLHLLSGEQLTLQEASKTVTSVPDLKTLLEKESKQAYNYFEWHELATHLIDRVSTIDEVNEICELMKVRISGYFEETHLVSVYTHASEKLYQLGYYTNSKQMIQNAVALTRPSGWVSYWDGGVKLAAMNQLIKVFGEESRKDIIRLYAQDLSERHQYPSEMVKGLDEIAQLLFGEIPYLEIWPDLEKFLDDLFSGTKQEEQTDLTQILDNLEAKADSDDVNNAIADFLVLYLDFPAFPVFNGAITACAKMLLANSLAAKNALKSALREHDQVVRQALIALEIVSLKKPADIYFIQDELAELQKSPNMILRMMSTKILINISAKAIYPPSLNLELPSIYSIHLPEIAVHHTDETLESFAEPVLLRDPALELKPFDIEARAIAERAGVAESNLLYHTIEKLRELETERTWLLNGAAMKPNELTVFLDKINLQVSHNKPKIYPTKNSLAHIAAELYDANRLSHADLGYLEAIFRDYDPTLFLSETKPRPSFIAGMGGLPVDMSTYVSIPKDWGQTLESSIPLLMDKSSDGRIILGEWTHLKRLENEWPTEERILFQRAIPAYRIWDDIDMGQEKLPFASVIGLHTSDYLAIRNFAEKELILAHKGYRYQMGKADWLGLNPRVGLDLGWSPTDGHNFAWKDKNNQVVAESIYWQDGNFDSYNWFDHVETGYGWLVLITETGYQELRRRYGQISRGGVIKRSLGSIGSKFRTQISSTLNTL